MNFFPSPAGRPPPSGLGSPQPLTPRSGGSYFPFHTPLVQFSSVAQLCPALSDPMDCRMLGLLAHHQLPEFTQTHVCPGILQARTLEWVAISFSNASK